MRKLSQFLLSCAALFFAVGAEAEAASSWQTYRMPKAGFTVDVPAASVTPLAAQDFAEESDNSEDGKDAFQAALSFSLKVDPPPSVENNGYVHVGRGPPVWVYRVQVRRIPSDNRLLNTMLLSPPRTAETAKRLQQSGVEGMQYTSVDSDSFTYEHVRVFIANGRAYRLSIWSEDAPIPSDRDTWFDTWKLLTPPEKK